MQQTQKEIRYTLKLESPKFYSSSGILQATGSSCGKLFYLHYEDHSERCDVKDRYCTETESNQAGGLDLWHQRLEHA